MENDEKVRVYIKKLADARKIAYEEAAQLAIVEQYRQYMATNTEITAD